MYGKVEARTWKICDGGLDFGALSDTTEYCDSLFFDAWESGLCRFERAAGDGDDVIKGCKAGWFELAEGDAGDPVGGEAVDMTAVISTVAGDPKRLVDL